MILVTAPSAPCAYTESVMLTIETLSDGQTTTLVLTGDLSETAVFELEQRWRKCPALGSVQLDLCDVDYICPAGKCLLAEMFADGVSLVVGSRASA